MNRPFDDRAGAAQMKAPGVTGDGNGAEVEGRRIAAIDRDLALGGGLALRQGREIHIGKPDRALHLVDVGAGQEELTLDRRRRQPGEVEVLVAAVLQAGAREQVDQRAAAGQRSGHPLRTDKGHRRGAHR